MDFKFKDEDKKTEDEAAENEATKIDTSGLEFTQQEAVENKAEESEVFQPEAYQSNQAEGETLEPYNPNSQEVADEVVEKEGPGVQVGGGGAVQTVQGDQAAARPKYRIPLDDEETKKPFSLPIKQIFLVIVLLGGGYYVKTYHGKENKPTRVDTPPVVAVQETKPVESSIEELSGILDESKELLRSREEEAKRLRNLESVRRASSNRGVRKIDFQALKDYKGQWVTLRMKDGLEREGRIADVIDQIVHLEQDYEYGTIAVRVPIQNIADIRE